MSSRTCLLLPKSIDFVQNGSSWSDSAIYKNLGLEKSKQICNNKCMDRGYGVNEMEDLKDLNMFENPCATRDRTQWGGGL